MLGRIEAPIVRIRDHLPETRFAALQHEAIGRRMLPKGHSDSEP
jgi:hypothetical protein